MPVSLADGAVTTQIEIEARQRETGWQSRCDGKRRVKAKYATTLLATKMNVRRMFSRRGGRKTIDPTAVRAFVRQAARDEPVEDAIQRHTIKCGKAQ